MQQSTDLELVAKVLDGDVDSYAYLVRKYQDAYFRFAVRMLGNQDDADDALQSAFVRAFRKLRECRDPARFGAWLYQIVMNECRTLAARRDRRERRMVRDIEDLDVAVPGPIQEPSRPMDLEEVERALARLEPDQREAFLLKHVEQLSYEEISVLTGVGVSALKMRVKRACDRLRQLLDPTRSLS